MRIPLSDFGQIWYEEGVPGPHPTPDFTVVALEMWSYCHQSRQNFFRHACPQGSMPLFRLLSGGGIFLRFFNSPWRRNYWDTNRIWKVRGANMGRTSSCVTRVAGCRQKSVMFCFFLWRFRINKVCDNGNSVILKTIMVPLHRRFPVVRLYRYSSFSMDLMGFSLKAKFIPKKYQF